MTRPDIARDPRVRAREDLATDLAVTAGAGSGKTTVLVDRFVRIAREPGLGPDRILAVTFTDKAAAEMKERVVREFTKAGDQARRRASEAAFISTIHGFAARLLREHPFEARVDPSFGVLTEYDRALFFAEALAETFARPDLTPHVERLKRERRGDWRVLTVVRDVSRLLHEGPEGVDGEAAALGTDTEAVEWCLARARAHCGALEGRAVALLRNVIPLLRDATYAGRTGTRYERAMAYLEAARASVAAGRLAGGLGVWNETSFTACIHADEREAVKAIIHEVKAHARTALGTDWSREEALERELLPLKRALYAAAHDIDARYEEHKRTLNVLDFHDLQLRAVRLLEAAPSVRARYTERFRHILLDEAQDTDRLQHRLLSMLHDDRNVRFTVGDPKQAIYEFRGADPDVFREALDRMPAANRLELRENFRSRAELLALVNRVGDALLPGTFFELRPRADYTAQPLPGPAVEAILSIRPVIPGVEQDDGSLGMDTHEPLGDARAREAAAVAERIVELLQEGRPVFDPALKAWVPIAPRHIAVLFRTRTPAPYFERALADRGVPYVTASGEGFYERTEVLDCLMLLRAVDQPLDDLAFAALLRSPMAGATDADLWALRYPDPRPEDLRDDRPLYEALESYPPLAEFRNAFEALRRRSRARPAAEVLDDALATFGYEAALASHPDGRAMLANVAKLRRLVADFGAITAGEAVGRLQLARELLDREAMAPLEGAGDDVVVLSTVHGSKGLEWPVVCLPNLQAKARGNAPAFSTRHGCLLLPALENGEEVRPLSQEGAVEELKRRADAEERRLFYVALTRARERLILSASLTEKELGEGKPGEFKSPFSFLGATLGEAVRMPGTHELDETAVVVRHVGVGQVGRTPFLQGGRLIEACQPASGPLVAPEPSPPAPRPSSLKVTELLAYERCPQVHRFAHLLEIREHIEARAETRGATHGRSAIEVGTIVHGLLERVRFDAPPAEEVRRLLVGQPKELQGKLEAMLREVLESELGTQVRSAKRVVREWPFVTSVDGILLEGVIDLALQAPDGTWSVIDYKSNDLSRLDRKAYLIGYYTPQLELYATALQRAGLGTVAECALVFLNGPVTHRWPFDPAALARREGWARDLVGRIAAGEYATTAGAKCTACGYRKRKICDTGRGWSAGRLEPVSGLIEKATSG